MKFLIAWFCIFYVQTSFSAEINFSAQYDESLPGNEDLGLNLLLPIENQSWEVAVEEVWEERYIPVGDIFIKKKILEKKELRVTNGKDSVYYFDDNKYALVGSTDQARSPENGAQFPSSAPLNNRPTLFVLIPGAALSEPDGGKFDDWPWFSDMEVKVREFQQNQDSESVLMHVVWSSSFPNKSQVRQVGNRIKDFLNQYGQHKWDVVIFGHSRGGIFTHELSQELESDKIKNLVTVLIDPTAALPMGDFYPTSKARSVTKGILYIDGEAFIYLDVAPTVSDRSIPGYDEFVFDACYGNTDPICSHTRIQRDYIKSHYFTNDLAYIASLKNEDREKNQYSVLNTPWINVTTRDAPAEHMIVDIGGAVEGGNFHGYFTTPVGGAQIVTGQDGLSIGYSAVVMSADLIISKQGFQVGGKAGSISGTLAIDDKDIARVNVKAGGVVEGDVSLTKGGQIKFEAGPIKVSVGW